MGTCRSKQKFKIGIKTHKDVGTSTHLEEKIFELKESNIKKKYGESIRLESPSIDGSCSDSDCASNFLSYYPYKQRTSPMREMCMDSDSESYYQG